MPEIGQGNMANVEQLELLRSSITNWNKWREDGPDTKIDLRKANLRVVNLREANLSEADLNEANLSGADLIDADLREANLINANLTQANFIRANLTWSNLSEATLTEAFLRSADLSGANLRGANLTGAYLRDVDFNEADLGESILRGANLRGADFLRANLTGADLTGADLSGANLVETNISNARISKSNVYGVNVWSLEGEFQEQYDLVITPQDQPEITVDNIKVAQFIYLILSNEEIRDVINTLTSKSVLILGRFAIPERKVILDALRDKLREYSLLPIVFDFDRPTNKDFTETIKTLAGLSYFVIADVTNPKSSPLELQATVPDYQIPFVPIIQEGEQPFAMMVDLQKKYNWVLPTRSYDSIETLMKALKPGIIDPAVEMRNKLRLIKAQEHPTESLRDYLDKSL